MDQDIKRLMMRFEHLLRTANREAINPEIEELSIENLKPMIELVAKSRAAYLKYVYDLSIKYNGSDEYPRKEEMEQLKLLHNRFTELTAAAQAFETSIQRGYLDIK